MTHTLYTPPPPHIPLPAFIIYHLSRIRLPQRTHPPTPLRQNPIRNHIIRIPLHLTLPIQERQRLLHELLLLIDVAVALEFGDPDVAPRGGGDEVVDVAFEGREVGGYGTGAAGAAVPVARDEIAAGGGVSVREGVKWGGDDIRLTGIIIITTFEKRTQPARSHRDPSLIVPAPTTNRWRANLRPGFPLRHHQSLVRRQRVRDPHIRLPNIIGFVERHEILMPGRQAGPVVAVRRLVGPQGGDEEELGGGVEGVGVPVVDPADVGVGEDGEGGGGGVVGEAAFAVAGAGGGGVGYEGCVAVARWVGVVLKG